MLKASELTANKRVQQLIKEAVKDQWGTIKEAVEERLIDFICHDADYTEAKDRKEALAAIQALDKLETYEGENEDA